MDNEKRVKISGFCPNCASKLDYFEGDRVVTCNCCDMTVNVENIRTGSLTRPVAAGGSFGSGLTFGAGMSINANYASLTQSIDTPESALVYVKSVYDKFDWEHYKLDGILFPEQVSVVVEDKKIKNGSSPIVWLLDFESKVVPLNHKLDSLKELEEKMYKVYDSQDYTKSLEVFATYSFIMRLLYLEKDNIIKDLEGDLEYAKQFKLDANNVKRMESGLKDLKARFEEIVHLPAELKDEKIIIKAQKDLDHKFVKEYAQRTGQDAIANYKDALAAYEAKDFTRAASLFSSLKGYADCTWYLEKLNKSFLFDKTIIKIGEKNYYIKRTKNREAQTFNVKNPMTQYDDSNSSQEFNSYSYSLYAIDENLHREKDPLLVGITQIITTFAEKLIYIRKNEDICYFNSTNNSVTVLIDGKRGDFSISVDGKKETSNAFYFNKDRTAIFFRQKLIRPKKEEKEGCFSMFKKKKVEKEIINLNNFSLMMLDLVSLKITKVIPELIDIVEYKNTDASKNASALNGVVADYGDIIFYQAEKPEDRKEDGTSEPRIYIYNLRNGEELGVIQNDCEINDVIGDYIIYSQWTPNDYNKNLWVLNVNSNESTLIEDNMLDFKFANEQHIFYTVGNDYICPLFSNTYDGKSRTEILRYVERVADFKSGWMYVIKGRGINKALVKISEDGLKRVVVCTQLQQIIKITPSNVYYIDDDDDLCCVRVDGSDYKMICEEVNAKNVIIDDNRIFIFRNELVDNDVESFSLYTTDIEGNNMKKEEFNITNAQNFDENYIYIRKDENLRFEYKDLNESGDEYKTEVSHHRVSYMLYDKHSGELIPIVMTNDPTGKEKEVGGGCFKKKKKYLPTYTLIPNKIRVKRKNIAAAGAVNKQYTAAEAAERAVQESKFRNNYATRNGAFLVLLLFSIGIALFTIIMSVVGRRSLSLIVVPISFSASWFVAMAITLLAAKSLQTKKGALIGAALNLISLGVALLMLYVYNRFIGGIIIGSLFLFIALIALLISIISVKKKFISRKANVFMFVGSGVLAGLGALFLVLGILAGVSGGSGYSGKGKHGGSSMSSATYLSSSVSEVYLEAYDYSYFEYSPSSSGNYLIYTDDNDVYITIYDSNGYTMDMTYDYDSGYECYYCKSYSPIYIRLYLDYSRDTTTYLYFEYLSSGSPTSESTPSYSGTTGSSSRNSSAPSLSTGNNYLALDDTTRYFQYYNSKGKVSVTLSSSDYYFNYCSISCYNYTGSSITGTDFTFDLTADGTYYFGMSCEYFDDYRDITISLKSVTDDSITGYSSMSSSAPTLSAGTSKLVVTESATYFKIYPSSNSIVTFLSTGSYDPSVTVYDKDGNVIASDDDSGTNYNFSVSFGALASEYYYFAPVISGTTQKISVNLVMNTSTVNTKVGNDYMNSSAPSLSTGTYTYRMYQPKSSYFKYVPSSNGTLTLYSTGSYNPKVTIYDEDGNILSSDNDSGPDYNFQLSQILLSGERYYISFGLEGSARTFYDISVNASFSSTSALKGYSSRTSSAPSLSSGTNNSVIMTSEITYFKITTPSSGYSNCTIYSTGDYTTSVSVYNTSNTLVASDTNTGSSGNFDVDFSISYSTTYYVGVTLSGSSDPSIVINGIYVSYWY